MTTLEGRSQSLASRRPKMTSATGTRHGKHRRAATSRGVSALMYAAQQGDVERVRKIIREQADALLTRDRTGKTPLHYCCTSDNICAAQAADLMVVAAPDLVETRDEDGFTPLHLAVIAGNIPLVTFLLANKADVNAVDNEKHTVVHWATVCGETAALRAVLAAGAPVSTPDVHGGYPLHYAAQMCGGEKDSDLGLQVLQTLLTHSDIVVSVEDGDGRQPLLWAASAGSAKAVLALVRAGSAVEASDKDGLTALHCAASRGHTDCIDSLLTLCGASPDVIDSNGCTALHYAVTLGHADATALLLAHAADPNRQDRKGRTPAHCGCAKGQFETVKMIGAHGANLWLRNARGDLPLHEAAASGRRDLVRWLLDMRPSQVNARNNDGRCPLHLAALNDNADMCKILLDAGAQINPILRTSKNTFMTPLDCALQRGFRSTAKFLQLHGGVPANRLGDIRHGQASAGINLQIKDDVTFWGDTSSDSERENGNTNKYNKRIQRKKLTHKYEKKKASLSGSDVDTRLRSGKVEGGRSVRRKFGEKSYRKRSDSSDVSKTSERVISSNKIDYKNEIIINGKTEITIHNGREIKVEGEEVVTKLPTTASTEVAEKVLNELSTEKEKRPKSAKTKEDSAKQKTKTERPNSKLKQGSIEQSKQNETTEEKSTDKTKSETNAKENGEINKKMPDQQSLMSNTSEDVEEQKSLVVEAAIHEPPKDVQEIANKKHLEVDVTSEEAVETAKETEIKQETDKSERINIENDELVKKEMLEAKVDEQSNEKIDAATENLAIVEKWEQETQLEKKEVEKDISHEDMKEADDERGKITVENVNVIPSEKLQEISQTQTEILKTKDALKDTEITRCKNDVDKTKDTEEKEEQSIVMMTTQENDKDEITVSDKEKIVGEEAKIGKTDTLETENSHDLSETKEKISENEDENKIVDNKNTQKQKDRRKHKKTEKTPDTNRTKSETVKDKNADIKGKKYKKEKLQTKDKRHKKSPPKDQAYEIIYKTLGAEEDETEFPNGTEHSEKSTGKKLETQQTISVSSEEELSTDIESESSTSSSITVKEHKSFRILNDQEADEIESRKSISSSRKPRSRSEEYKPKTKDDKIKKSKIPTPLGKSQLSKSDKYLNVPPRKSQSSMDSRVPSLPNINESKKKINESPRPESNMSAPLLASTYSDNEKASVSELEEEQKKSSASRRKKIKRRAKTREAKSAGSDYESSNVIDSGFEPSPRSSRIPKCRNISDRGVNMTSVTQSIQSNIRRYHLERKIFQHLLDLKRMQIRAGQHNEAVLVKRAIDSYHQSCASTVGAGRYVPEDYTFKSFEKFLYLSLRKLQRNGADHLKGLPESASNPLLCTQSTHRCMHATHAYTGIPCAAYLPKMDHHTIPKIGFTSTQCKPGTGFLPTINPKKAVTLELCHGNDKQVISLPADRLDQNKRYYVTFTVKGSDNTPPNEETTPPGHKHSKSD